MKEHSSPTSWSERIAFQTEQPSLPPPLSLYSVLTGHIMKRAVDLREEGREGGREKQWEQTIDPSRGGEKQHLQSAERRLIFPLQGAQITQECKDSRGLPHKT